MVKIWKASAFAITALLVCGGLLVMFSANAGATPSMPAACTTAPTVSATATPHGFTVTVTGKVTTEAGAGCVISYVSINWGDYYTSTQDGNLTDSELNISQTYTYPSTGTYSIVVTAYLETAESAQQTLSVTVHGPPYDTLAAFDMSYHLPGDPAELFIEAENSTTGGLQSDVTAIFITTCYSSTATGAPACSTVPSIPTHPTPANLTSIPFLVPPQAATDSYLYATVEINATTPTGNFNENGSASMYIATPVAPTVCVSSTVSGTKTCSPTTAQFEPGENFVLTVYAYLTGDGSEEPWDGAALAVTFYLNNEKQVTPTGFPTNLSTDVDGTVQAVVQTGGANAIGTGELNITVALSDSHNSAVKSPAPTTIFVNLKPSPSTKVQVTLGADEYFGGDELTSSFQITSFSGTPTTGWHAYDYLVIGYYEDSGSCPGSGTSEIFTLANVTGTSGNLPNFKIPLSFQGVMLVVVSANNATESVTGEACTLVLPPELLVEPSETTYFPGDTIGVSLDPEGGNFAGATYFAEVSNTGTTTVPVVLFNQSLGSSTSFSFKIPATGTLPSYILSVLAQTINGTFAAQDITLTEYSGYKLVVSVATVSQYSDGSFRPGTTISFSYVITALGSATLPSLFYLNATFVNSAGGPTVVEETSPTGTFNLPIPSSSGTGTDVASFGATIPTASGLAYADTEVGVLVNPTPSVLDYELFGAGSGFTVAHLLVIIVLAAAAILVYLVIRQRRESGMPKLKKQKKKEEGVDQWGPNQPQQPQDQQPMQPAGGDMGYQYPPMDQQMPPPPMDTGAPQDGRPPIPGMPPQ